MHYYYLHQFLTRHYNLFSFDYSRALYKKTGNNNYQARLKFPRVTLQINCRFRCLLLYFSVCIRKCTDRHVQYALFARSLHVRALTKTARIEKINSSRNVSKRGYIHRVCARTVRTSLHANQSSTGNQSLNIYNTSCLLFNTGLYLLFHITVRKKMFLWAYMNV